MTEKFTIGQWRIDAIACEISRAGTTHKLSPRAMAVLEQLAAQAGEVVTFEEFLAAHWARSVTSPNAVHKVVAELRHALGEDSGYIETVPKRGYRLIAPVAKVEHANGSQHSENGTPTVEPGDLSGSLTERTEAELPHADSAGSQTGARRSGRWMVLGGTVVLMVLAVFVWRGQSSSEPKAVILDALGRSAILLSPTVSGVDLTPASFSTISEQVFTSLQTSIAATRHPSREGDRSEKMSNAHYIVSVDVTADNETMHADLSYKPATEDLPVFRERLDAPASEIKLLIGDVVAHLSDDLKILLDPARTEEMRRWGTQNVHAYQLAQRADAYQRIMTIESQKQAELLFREAIGRDPQFPYAYGSIATIYVMKWQTPTNDEAPEAARRDLQALARDARTALTDQTMLAQIEREYRFVSTTTAFDAGSHWSDAVHEDPHDIEALQQFSEVLIGAKLLNESEAYLELAIDQAKSTGKTDARLENQYATYSAIRGDFDRAIALNKENVDNSFLDLTTSLYGLVQSLAYLGRFREAESYLVRLKASNSAWGNGAELIMAAHRGDLPPGSGRLHEALAKPGLLNVSRGIACFVVGDIECGITYWREMEPTLMPTLWRFMPVIEVYFANGVVADARYQALLDELGVGRKWREHMREAAAKLTPVTGIEVTTPPPPEDTSIARL